MYSPTVGRFMTRDPLIYAAGDPNLYRYVAGSPLSAVDATGQVACCCCCVDKIGISGIQKYPQEFAPGTFAAIPGWDDLGQYGHVFNVDVSVSYVPGGRPDQSDCQLVWEERTNGPPYAGVKPNQWTDMFSLQPDKKMFDPWTTKRKKPCPGAESFSIFDAPFAVAGLGRRVLQFRITVKSAPDCRCSFPERSITAIQTLDADVKPQPGRISAQDFKSPDPTQ